MIYILPYAIVFAGLFILVCILNAYNNHLERKRKEKFKKLAQRRVYLGTPEQLERLRKWSEDNGYPTAGN